MLKMVGEVTKDGKPTKFVVFGLSHMNLARLKEGQPIKVDGAEIGMSGVDFLIFSGPTEREMAREMAELVGPNTRVNINPRVTDA
jgi:hypothetical protein